MRMDEKLLHLAEKKPNQTVITRTHYVWKISGQNNSYKVIFLCKKCPMDCTFENQAHITPLSTAHFQRHTLKHKIRFSSCKSLVILHCITLKTISIFTSTSWNVRNSMNKLYYLRFDEPQQKQRQGFFPFKKSTIYGGHTECFHVTSQRPCWCP